MRRFEFSDQRSSKFWAIERDGVELITRWGRIGATGQSTRKAYASEAAAASELDKQARGKLGKGYVEVVASEAEPNRPQSVQPTPAPTPTRPQSVQATPTPTPELNRPQAVQPIPAPAPVPVPAPKRAQSVQLIPAPAPAPVSAPAPKRPQTVRPESAAVQPPATAQPPAAVQPPATAQPPAQPPAESASELEDGAEIQVAGSGSRSYTVRNVGGVYSCSCPAWLHQSAPAERRTCKHLRKLRGDAAEQARLGAELAVRPRSPRSSGAGKGTSAAVEAGAPALLLAHSFRREDHDPTGWWLSEKLDGVRAYWDGTQFVSRLGNGYLAPQWFTAGLPKFPLDGELFAGRGKFQHTVSVARRMDRGDGWRTLSYVIFDAPALEHGFEDRLRHLDDHFGAQPWEHARVLDHRVCAGLEDLEAELARIEGLGGEGLMLRRPGSPYVSGRSDSLLKVKSFLDGEARVTGHQPGTGKHSGRLGALLVELPNGTRFKVGTGMSDAERNSPPEIGAIVTVRYQELTNAGVPRFPTYVGIRADVDWAALVAGAAASED